MNTHSAYLFDWRAFQHESHPLVKSIDRGDFAPLLAQARLRVDHFRAAPETWLLASPPGPDIQTLPTSSGRLKPKDVGFCFLLLVAAFLKPCPASLGEKWKELAYVVSSLNDNMRVGKLLTCGWSTLTLLRPECASEPATDGNGWLEMDTIRALQERLRPQRPLITKNAFAYLLQPTYAQSGVPALDQPSKVEAFLFAYDQALAMLAAAVEANMGLFFSFVH